VEISQVVPPEILSSIAQVRAAAEAASPAAHGALKHSVEAAEVIGTLTENVELAMEEIAIPEQSAFVDQTLVKSMPFKFTSLALP